MIAITEYSRKLSLHSNNSMLDPEHLALAGKAHVLVEDLGSPVLSLEDRHHLGVVRRLKDGESITLGDGYGGWRTAVVKKATSNRKSKEIDIEPFGDIKHEPKLNPKIIIGFVVPALDRATWAVQKMTELGVDEIHLLNSEYSSSRFESLSFDGKDYLKLKKVIRESVMQCRAPYLPNLVPILEFDEFISDHPECAMCSPFGDDELLPGVPTIIGPEGGFSVREMSMVGKKVGLSSNILRSETAAVAASAAMSLARLKISLT